MQRKSKKIEFGDFQTPYLLAVECCKSLRQYIPSPSSIFEPTCGLGNFLAAGRAVFPDVSNFVAVEINSHYVETAKSRFAEDKRVSISQEDFFAGKWKSNLVDLPRPLLILGNPPWVTNAVLGSIEGANLPRKSNIDAMTGMDARTGKSNFDVSEWILLEACRVLNGDNGSLAVLCKTSVARKILARLWREQMQVQNADIVPFDAKLYFGVAVSACLLIVKFSPLATSKEAVIRRSLSDAEPIQTIGFADDRIVAHPVIYSINRHLASSGGMKWRSGIKHDAAEVMELKREGSKYRNGLGEELDIEEDCIFPLFKSSDIHNGALENRRFLLVPQRSTGDLPSDLRLSAPKAWKYLEDHRGYLLNRRSSIYRNRPDFSIFGVGPYTFKPWKVAISGLYKSLNFRLFGPVAGKVPVFDDTVYFLSFDTQLEARTALDYLSRDEVIDFLGSQVFWDAKRPITAEMLNRLYISPPASSVGVIETQSSLFHSA